MNPALNLRSVADLTQAQAAELLGVALRTWKSWEASATMPAKKAQAFRDAVLQRDAAAAPDGPDNAVQTAAQYLRGLGRAALPTIYSEDDVFGQKRLAHLRRAVVDPDKANQVDADREPVQDANDSGVLTSDDIGDDEIAGLLAQVAASKNT